MTATLDHAEDVDAVRIAYLLGIKAGLRGHVADPAERIAELTGEDVAAEILTAVDEILARAGQKPEPKPGLPSRIPAQARPGGRPS
jgi:hypothetical protein